MSPRNRHTALPSVDRRIVDASRSKTSHSISGTGKDLLNRTSIKLGITQSAALEIAIRKLAEQEGVR